MACAAAIEKIYERENCKIGYEGNIEGKYPGGGRCCKEKGQEDLLKTAKNHGQVIVTEAPKNKQEEYLQLHFIPYLQSDRIPLFEPYICRSNEVVKMSYHLLYLNLPIRDGTISSNMFGLANTVAILNLVNLE